MQAHEFSKAAFFKSLGYEPHSGQGEIHNSTAPRRIVASGVRWGKTLSAAMEGLAAAMQPRQRSIGWVVAPTYDLADKVYREIAIIVAEHLRHRIVSIKDSEKRVVIRNMAGGISEIRGKSADNPVSLLGEGLDWVIIDEAARLKPLIWESHVAQRLVDKKGWALMISTPRGKGWFYELYRRGQGNDPAYASWNCPSWTNPHLDAALIEQERSRLPERVFRQEFGGEFIEGSGAVFRNVRDVATGTFQDPIPDTCYYSGLDLARVEDFSVLVIMNTKREVVFVDRFTKLDWNLQLNRIRTAVKRYNHAQILVDSTGAGEPIYENLLHAGCSVQPYSFTQRTKAALIDNLAICFEKKIITLPRPDLWPEGAEECESFEYSITEAGSVRTTAPGGTHDDCVIALALAAWQVRPARPQPSVTVGYINSAGELVVSSSQRDDDDDDDHVVEHEAKNDRRPLLIPHQLVYRSHPDEDDDDVYDLYARPTRGLFDDDRPDDLVRLLRS